MFYPITYFSPKWINQITMKKISVQQFLLLMYLQSSLLLLLIYSFFLIPYHKFIVRFVIVSQIRINAFCVCTVIVRWSIFPNCGLFMCSCFTSDLLKISVGWTQWVISNFFVVLHVCSFTLFNNSMIKWFVSEVNLWVILYVGWICSVLYFSNICNWTN